jgi:hypothetical protein
MYKPHPTGPKKFGRSTSSFRAKPRFGAGRFSRPKNKKRFGGDRIDVSRFIK